MLCPHVGGVFQKSEVALQCGGFLKIQGGDYLKATKSHCKERGVRCEMLHNVDRSLRLKLKPMQCGAHYCHEAKVQDTHVWQSRGRKLNGKGIQRQRVWNDLSEHRLLTFILDSDRGETCTTFLRVLKESKEPECDPRCSTRRRKSVPNLELTLGTLLHQS